MPMPNVKLDGVTGAVLVFGWRDGVDRARWHQMAVQGRTLEEALRGLADFFESNAKHWTVDFSEPIAISVTQLRASGDVVVDARWTVKS